MGNFLRILAFFGFIAKNNFNRRTRLLIVITCICSINDYVWSSHTQAVVNVVYTLNHCFTSHFQIPQVLLRLKKYPQGEKTQVPLFDC